MNYHNLLKQASDRAVALDKESSAALIILEHASGLSSQQLYLNMNATVDTAIIDRFNSELNKYLIDNIPVQYIVGYSSFYGYDFIVNKDVLIPRPETEELVENILYRYDTFFKGQKIDVADVATGSGCIGITLAKEEPNMKVVVTDISAEALVVCKQNAAKIGVDIEMLCGDMVEPLKGRKFDILVSNPPYIPDSEIVMPLVKDNEPNIALFGGSDGLKFYRVILSNCKELLKDRAIIAFEHGYDKKEEIIALAKTYFKDSKVEVLKDLEGRDRMTFIYIGGSFNE